MHFRQRRTLEPGSTAGAVTGVVRGSTDGVAAVGGSTAVAAAGDGSTGELMAGAAPGSIAGR